MNPIQAKKLYLKIGKRNLVDVMIVEGMVEGCGSGEKKMNGQETFKEIHTSKPEMVLGRRHRLQQ